MDELQRTDTAVQQTNALIASCSLQESVAGLPAHGTTEAQPVGAGSTPAAASGGGASGASGGGGGGTAPPPTPPGAGRGLSRPEPEPEDASGAQN